MIKRIIFDIDNTIIKNVDLKKAISNTLKEFNINDKTEIFTSNIIEYEKKYNKYDKKLYLDFFSEKLNEKLSEEFLNKLFNNLKECVPKDNKKIKEVLNNLKDYELVLLSNYFEFSQRNRLKKMKINDYFTEYYGENITKPNKEAYLQAKGKHKEEECVIIGDNLEYDIEVPKRLGFKTIYINDDAKIKSIEELTKEIIENI